MDRYTLTYEGRAKFRRMDMRAGLDESTRTEDFKILHYIYENGAASVDEMVSYTGLRRGELVNKLMGIMNRGYIEVLPGH
jgi:DNA-binding MarR family transcriptional regulator